MVKIKVFRYENQKSINDFLKDKKIIGHGTIRTENRDDILYIYYINVGEVRDIQKTNLSVNNKLREIKKLSILE